MSWRSHLALGSVGQLLHLAQGGLGVVVHFCKPCVKAEAGEVQGCPGLHSEAVSQEAGEMAPQQR